VQLPAVGDTVTAGAAVGEVESTKSVSDIYAPVSGTVVAVNDSLENSPELINSGPYQAGWMMDVRLADDAAALSDLLDATAYGELTGS
jgi:glycine cleavage system H protein